MFVLCQTNLHCHQAGGGLAGVWTWEDAGEDVSGALSQGTSPSGAQPPRELEGEERGRHTERGDTTNGSGPT